MTQPHLDDLDRRAHKRLAELTEGREKFITDAQRQLAGLDAAIAEIKALLDPPAPESQPDLEAIERAARLIESRMPEQDGTSDDDAIPTKVTTPAMG